jgi:hypothetical protein
MGQTVKLDLDLDEVVCFAGSFGPVGSPGWRSRDESGDVVVNVREEVYRSGRNGLRSAMRRLFMARVSEM